MYNQPVKEASRSILWPHAINSLQDENFRILNREEIHKIAHSANEVLENKIFVDSETLTDTVFDWSKVTFAHHPKKTTQMKVAFFCGPDPVFDLNHLLRLGIRIEHIWMFELDKNLFNEAKSKCSENSLFPNFFFGNINDFIASQPDRFDIVYLDFTKSLISEDMMPLKTIERVFNRQMLTEKSFLIVNSCYPDKSEKNIDFLSSYFHKREWINIEIDNQKGIKESFEAYSIYDIQSVKNVIDSDFDNAYSEYSSSIISNFASVWSPSFRLSNTKSFRQFFFENANKINELINLEIDNNASSSNILSNISNSQAIVEDLHLCAGEYPEWYFLDFINNSKEFNKFKNFLCNKFDGNAYSYFDSLKMFYLLNNIEEGNYYYVSNEMKEFLTKFKTSTIEFQVFKSTYGGVFCDVPMSSQWVGILYGKYGHPYHLNPKYSKRIAYTAKERKMCLDVLAFDKCRELYDWVPTQHFFNEKYTDKICQFIIRSACDKIFKKGFYTTSNLLKYCHFVCLGDVASNDNEELCNRIEL